MKNVLKTRRASDVSLEELLAFERLFPIFPHASRMFPASKWSRKSKSR